MVVYSTVIVPDYDKESGTGGVNVQAWLDGLAGTTINWVTTAGLPGSRSLVLIVADKT